VPAPSFPTTVERAGLPALRRAAVTTLQVNVGLRCDLACHHCHVEAGPKRREALDGRLADRILALLERTPEIDTLDLTGGAPELNPHFRTLVQEARRLGRRVIDRCNLTVLFESGQEDTPEFLAREGVAITASLPCYTAENVDGQRGKRVYERSLAALRRLNALGYAEPGRGLALDLVYNPAGPSLPPQQAALEADYRRELGALGIRFDRLLTITNMPIKRFARDLARRGESEAYLALLVAHFNPETVGGLMCRSTLSVAWDGTLYDCDFNQALAIPAAAGPATLFELDDVNALQDGPIATAAHCFGCTAGAGSSCGGALVGIEGP